MTDKPMVPTPDALTKARGKPDFVEVPERTVIAVDGEGGPTTDTFSSAIQALYTVGYGLRFARKSAGRPAFKVGPLVGEWRAHAETLAEGALPAPEDWRWSLQIGVPAHTAAEEVAGAVRAATEKPKGKLAENAEARRIELRTLERGRFARVLHLGPYATEPESFDKIGALLAEHGLGREPWHVEVYLSDPGRTAPEKLKTALLTRVWTDEPGAQKLRG